MVMKLVPKNKKGSFQGLVIAIVILVVVALAAIIFSKVFLEITDELKSSGEFSDKTIDSITLVEDNTILLLDFLIFFSLIALIIGLIISSIYIDIHPVFTVIFLIVLIVAVFIAGQLTNVFTEVTTDAEITATASQFTYTNIILGEHFPTIILVVGIIIVIILFSKSRRVGEV